MARILVVDDEPHLRDLLKLLLEKEGYDVTVANDGKSGYACFRQEAFDLLVTDVLMPEEDGFLLIKRLRREGDQTPIICITAGDTLDSTSAYLRCAAGLGANRTLSKPINPDKLLDAVRELLAGGQL